MAVRCVNTCVSRFLAFFCAFGLLFTFAHLFYFLEFRKIELCLFTDREYGAFVREEALVINWSMLMFFVYSIGLLAIVSESRLLITVFGILKLSIVFFCLRNRQFDNGILLLLVLGNGTIAFLAFYVAGLFSDIFFIEPSYALFEDREDKSSCEQNAAKLRKAAHCYTICDKVEKCDIKR